MSDDFHARGLAALVLLAVGGWMLVLFLAGPQLAVNHDELGHIHGALRLLKEQTLQSYMHGPLIYELIAVQELGAYAVLRLAGRVASADDFLVSVLTNMPLHLAMARAITGIAAILMLVQVYRLGALFGGPRVGALSTLLCGTNLTFIALSSMSKEDAMLWLLLLTACNQAWKAVETGRTISALGAGAAIGAASAAKLFGVFGLLLLFLPMARPGPLPWRRRLHLSLLMVGGVVVATLVLNPFVLTDTSGVLANVAHTAAKTRNWPGLPPSLTLPAYLGVHLPNLVGWVVLVGGTIELARRLVREPRGPVVLTAVPLCLLALLGLRRGFSMAYYAFPLAVFLCVLTASLATLVAARLGLGWRYAAIAVGILVVFDGAFLPGALKHALILTRGSDTRLVARDLLHERGHPGDCVVMTDAIVGENFWGAAVLPLEEPAGAGPFARAQRRLLQSTSEPRFQLRVVKADPGFPPDLVRDCTWIVTPRFGWSTLEWGPPPRRTPPPREFQHIASIDATPRERAFCFPLLTSLDYRELAKTSLSSLLRHARYGWTLDIYRRASATSTRVRFASTTSATHVNPMAA